VQYSAVQCSTVLCSVEKWSIFVDNKPRQVAVNWQLTIFVEKTSTSQQYIG
jgi:hypothetical protein